MTEKFLEDYQKFVRTIMRPDKNPNMELCNWGLGITGEAADVASCIKKTVFHENDKTEGIRENLGDTLWYIGAICNHFGWKLEDIFKENQEKLSARFKDGNYKLEHIQRKGEMRDWNEE
jgi:NTP pyrophosphatase (non-canonical NTP hydrolase)